jgi:ABC-type lipoprotein release transport system permease subunit
VGRWQLGPVNPWVQGLLGAIWVHLAVWLLATGFNAQTGLMLIGRQVPGAELFRQNQRTFLPNLPPEMKESRDFLVRELSRIGIEKEDGEAMRAASVLSGEHPDAATIRFRDLIPWTQRRLAGLPWYYNPAEFEKDRVERCAVFWGCLLLAVMTLVRWPGLHSFLRHGALRGLLCIARLTAPTAATVACLMGTSGQANMIALFSGLGLVALGALALIFWLGWLVSRDTGATPHYAPFMAIRLLQKRRIAFFAIGAVTLCVAMVLIVMSVMGGFLDLVRDRSHGLLGDLVMENGSLQGFAGYEEFISRIKQLRDERGRPIIEEATPVIYTYGVLRFPVSYVTKPVRVVGIRIGESVRVTRFGESLNFEKYYPGTTQLGRQQQPCWGWNAKKLAVLPEPYEAARAKGLAAIKDQNTLREYERQPRLEYPGPGVYGDYSDTDAATMYRTLKDLDSELKMIGEDVVEARWLTSGVAATGPVHSPNAPSTTTTSTPASAPSLADRAMKQAARLEQLVERLPESPEAQALAGPLLKVKEQIMSLSDQLRSPSDKVGETINDILRQLQGPIDKLAAVRTRPGYGGKSYYGVIIGRDLIATREASGQYRRYDTYPRGAEMLVSVLPLTQKGTFTLQEPISLPLRYVDDSRTGVYDIDSICVYVDFAMLQRTMEMGRQRLKDGSGTTSPRASQVLIKLTPGQNVFARREQLNQEWTDFCRNWPHVRDLHMMGYVEFHTSEEQQAQFIAAVEKERNLVTTLFAVISAVAIFLVLCIFYMIVTEKTRDIGTLKSIGATAGGVAGIFLAYGAAIGVVGASLGLWIGTVFVHRINAIQDWMARISPGMRIWSPEVYTFDIIPDKVKFEDAAAIFVVAIIASVLGATFPALRAGRTWPVEALRYE